MDQERKFRILYDGSIQQSNIPFWSKELYTFIKEDDISVFVTDGRNRYRISVHRIKEEV